jgi:hypothetical protein
MGSDKGELPPVLHAQIDAMKSTVPEDYHFSKLPNEDDQVIADVCKTLLYSDENVRRAFANMLDKNLRSLLSIFAERMAMLSIRERNTDGLLHGLVALSALDSYEDYHTVCMVLSLLYVGATRLRADSEKLFQKVGNLAVDERIGQAIAKFPNRDPKDRRIEAMGYHEIDGPNGTIFIHASWLSKGIPDGLK